MAAQAAPLAGHYAGRRGFDAAHGAVQLPALGLHREDRCGAERHPRHIQGKGSCRCNLAIRERQDCIWAEAPPHSLGMPP